MLFSADEVPQVLPYALNSPVTIDENSLSEPQLTALTMKLAELQTQVLRLNALGDRLASEASIPEKEFLSHRVSVSFRPGIRSYINVLSISASVSLGS